MRKRTVLGFTGLLAAHTAFAAPTVTIYGLVDTYLGYTTAAGKPDALQLDTAGVQASRVGVRGAETLGRDTSLTFALENGFMSDSGSAAASSRILNRQAWVGISGKAGEFRIGRQNTLGFFMLGQMDAFFGATFASFLNNVVPPAPRYDNMLSWRSPEMDGLTLQVDAALGKVGGKRDALNSYMLGAEYKRPNLWIGGNAERRNSADDSFAMRTAYVGGNFTYGRVKVFLGLYRGNSVGANLVLNIPGSYYSAASLSSTYQLSSTTSIGAGYGAARNSADRRSGATQEA
jgi:predicted porin